MKAYKGFDKDLKCRGYQYEVGGEYEEKEAELCNCGFHACEAPLDTFGYYPPADSRYCAVELDGVTDEKSSDDTKRVGKKIKIGAEIGLPGIAAAHVEWIKEQVDWKNAEETNTGDRSAATNTGDRSAATNTGDRSAATNTGDQSAATNTGYRSAATNTGDQSAATNTGDQSAATNTGNLSAATNTGYRSAATNTGNRSAATNTGYRSAATNTGDRSAATNTGNRSAATNTGDQSAATNTGDQSAATNTGDQSAAEVGGKGSVAIAAGFESRVKGALGCAIVCVERGKWDGNTYPLLSVLAGIVDGKKLLPGTWYTVKGGKWVEC